MKRKRLHWRRLSIYVSMSLILLLEAIGISFLNSSQVGADSPPSSPPVEWCENGLPSSPYTTAPDGAVTIPAGDDSSYDNSAADTTYWFAPGTHTDLSVIVANDDTYIGAPGAIDNGGNSIQYAFQGQYNYTPDQDVTIEYLTIEDFEPTQGGGTVNGNGNNGWTEEYDLMEYNAPGAAMMLGGDNVVENNCLTENGEYGFNGYSYVDETFGDTFTGGATNITFSDNDVSYNNTEETEEGIEGGGKFWQNGNVTVTDNYFHNNIDSPGVWMDTDNAGFLVQDNYISDNGSEGLMYEISYNADIIDNTFIENGLTIGPTNPSFPTGAIYVSESGGNSTVPSNYAGVFNIQDNIFTNNWSGVIIYNNSVRYPGDGQDPGTLTPPSGVDIGTWINSTAIDDCPSDLAETTPVDYSSLCQWRSQNVTVQDNQFNFNPSDSFYDGGCSSTTGCGQNAIFATYIDSSAGEPYDAYPAWTIPNEISNDWNNVFSDNTYAGPWTFVYFNQGDIADWSQWTSGITDVQGSGDNFTAQDAGSTYTSTYNGNTPPTVSVTNLSTYQEIYGPSLAIDSTATANDGGSIVSAQLTVNGSDVGSALSSAPYDFNFNTIDYPDGTYTVGVLATDDQGDTNSNDVSVYISNGDLTGAGSVGLSDLAILADHYGTTTGATYAEGSILENGAVNLSDLAILAANWGWTS